MSTNPLVEKLYLAKALKESPLKIEASYLSLRSDLLASLARAFGPIVESLHYDFIYPVDLFSIPLATHFSIIYDIPLFLSHSEDSFMQPGQTALLLNASSSSSQLAPCLDALKKQNIFVSDALILLAPGAEDEKASQNLGISLHSLWDIKTLQNDLNTLLHQNSYSKIHSSDIS